MIRVVLTDPVAGRRVLTFTQHQITIGRSPDNDVCLQDRSVSKHHGLLKVSGNRYVYEDLNSTNGTQVLRPTGGDPQTLGREGEGTYSSDIGPGDAVRIASYSIAVDFGDREASGSKGEAADMTMVLSRPIPRRAKEHIELSSERPEVADLFARMVHETTGALRNQERLLDAISRFIFDAFESATHLMIVVLSPETAKLDILVTRSRDGQSSDEVELSRTIVDTVISEETALLFSQVQERMGKVASISKSGIETTICAPLAGLEQTFGVIQVDVRRPGHGMFTKADLDLLAKVAGHIGLILDNLRLYQEQSRAFESTISALMHSLSLKDPETAVHSKRVRAISLLLGEELGLGEDQLEVLSVAAYLHDLGKQAVRDEVLFKPDRLNKEESEEMSQHAAHTQGILDEICFPSHLRAVPAIAAYHHEKMDGTGPYAIPGTDLPIETRIISVADAFDALMSARSYKKPKPLPVVLQILEDGAGTSWDSDVVAAAGRASFHLRSVVYDKSMSVFEAPDDDASPDEPADDDEPKGGNRRAA